MNKKRVLSFIGWFFVLLFAIGLVIVTILYTRNTNQQEVQQTETAEEIPQEEQTVENGYLSTEEEISSVVKAKYPTKDDLLELSAEDIEAFLGDEFKNYKEFYGVPDSYKMSKSDYVTFRNMLAMTIYDGSEGKSLSEEDDFVVSEMEIQKYLYNDFAGLSGEQAQELKQFCYFYYITENDLRSMSTDEFEQFLKDVSAYAGNYDLENIDLPPEQIEAIREAYIENTNLYANKSQEDIKNDIQKEKEYAENIKVKESEGE